MTENFEKERIAQLPLEEIQALIEKLEDEKRRRREEVKQKIRRLAALVGLEVSFSVKEERMPRPSRKAPPKYRHPEDPTIMWSGRGQMPRWLRELVDQGRDLEEFRIRRD